MNAVVRVVEKSASVAGTWASEQFWPIILAPTSRLALSLDGRRVLDKTGRYITLAEQRKVGILHISDLHMRGVRDNESWRRRRVLGDSWEQNLQEIRKETNIHLVCFTGDAANWGEPDEFEQATEFFGETLAQLELDWKRFFVVPGNHDIQRKIEEDAWKKVRTRLTQVEPLAAARWAEGSGSEQLDDIKKIISRQANYRAWLAKIDRQALLPNFHPNLGYRQELVLPECDGRVNIIGLDSAWLCGDNNDAEKLLLTDSQLFKLCQTEDGKPLEGLRLALVHHPLDHLSDAEDTRRILGKNVDLLLRGHRHQLNLSRWSDDSSDIRELAAGCLYEVGKADTYPNACTVIEIELDQQSRPIAGSAWFRSWSRRGHWHNDDSQYPTSKEGRLVLWQRDTLSHSPSRHRIPYKLPDNHTPRPKLESQLLKALLPGKTVGLWGTAGFGKTTLAVAACQSEELEGRFPDGIVWTTLGESSSPPTQQLESVLAGLTGSRLRSPSLEHAALKVAKSLEQKQVLLIVDDVWHKSHLSYFLHCSSSCCILITSRDRQVIPHTAETIEISELAKQQAQQLLFSQIPDVKISEVLVDNLLTKLGGWPLLLNLVNRALLESIDLGSEVSEAISWAEQILGEAGPTALDTRNAQDRNEAVDKTLQLSFNLLQGDEVQRYLELAIFPAGYDVPLPMVEALWEATGEMSKIQGEQLYRRLGRIALLRDLRLDRKILRIHDALRQYLIERTASELHTTHRHFLDHMAPPGRSWHELSLDEDYLWATLAYHLLEAQLADELKRLLEDSNFLATKAFTRGPLEVERDFIQYRTSQSDESLRSTENEFISNAHLFALVESREQAVALLHSRLSRFRELPLPSGLGPFLRPLSDLPDLNITAGRSRTIKEAGAVSCTCLAPSGGYVYAGTSAGTFRKWDIHTGALITEYEGHDAPICDCTISPDGTTLGSCDDSGAVRIWHESNASVLKQWRSDASAQLRCAFDPTGKYLYTSGAAAIPRMWDVQSGDEKSFPVTVGDSILASAHVSSDGRVTAASYQDGSLCAWDTSSGDLLLRIELPNPFPISGVEYAPATNLFVFDFLGVQFRVVDSQAKQISSHSTNLGTRPRFSHDGEFLSFGVKQDTAVVINARTGEALESYTGIANFVSIAQIDRHGEYLVSASTGGSIRVESRRTDATLAIPTNTYSCTLGWNNGCLAASTEAGEMLFWHLNAMKPGCEPRRLPLADHTVTTCHLSQTTEPAIFLAGTQKGHLIALSLGQPASIDFKHKVPPREGGSECYISCCDLSPDQETGAFGVDSHIEVWDILRKRHIRTLEGHSLTPNTCLFLPHGDLLVSASWDIRLWNLQTGDCIGVFPAHSKMVTSLNLSTDGSLMASTSRDQTIRVWSTSDWSELQTLRSTDDQLSHAAFSPTNELLAVSSSSGFLEVWSLRELRPLTRLPVAGALYKCVWFPDGKRILAVGRNGAYFFEFLE